MKLLNLSACLASLLISFLPSSDAQAYQFILSSTSILVTERIDPILSPGVPSNHLHSIQGANGFNSGGITFAQTQAATCSTVQPKADKSNYWTASLFFHAKNGSFIRVLPTFSQIYYFYGASSGPDLELSEFPQEFRMITGSAQLRSNDPNVVSKERLKYTCIGSSGTTSSAGFPTGFTECDSLGLRVEIVMPTCWNGQNFNPGSPGAHMAYATGGPGLAGCPTGFKVKRFPRILFETYHNVGPFNGLYSATDQPWVLANGDPTGYSYHVDFVNGWVPGKLQAAMKTCNGPIGGGGTLSSPDCFGSTGLYTNAEKDACSVRNRVNEPYGLTGPGSPLSALPGCNPIQSGPASATIASNCGAPTTLN